MTIWDLRPTVEYKPNGEKKKKKQNAFHSHSIKGGTHVLTTSNNSDKWTSVSVRVLNDYFLTGSRKSLILGEGKHKIKTPRALVVAGASLQRLR